MLQVFAYRLEDKAEFEIFFQKIRELIPQKLLSKIEKFKFSSDQQRSLIGNLIVRGYYSKAFEVNPFQIEFEYNDHEKPLLKGKTRDHFNISHSGDYVTVVFSDCPVGIDIEKNKGNRLKIANRFFTKEEVLDLNAFTKEDQKISYFYQLWTLKESYMKAIGKGISMSLDSFSFKKIQQDYKLRYSSEDSAFQFSSYKIHADYACSLCSKYPIKPVIEEINLRDIEALLNVDMK